MILPISNVIPEYNNGIFDCVSLKNEILVKPNTTEMLDYMVTVYPRNESISGFNFVFGLFDFTPTAFSINQNIVIHFANEMFSNSQPLSDFESAVLSKTFKRLTKMKPTLSGRK